MKPKLTSTEPMRLPHRQQDPTLQCLTKPGEAQDSSFLPTAKEMSQLTATFCSHKAGRAEVGEVCWCHMFTLHSVHMGTVFETVTPFRGHLVPEAASTPSINIPMSSPHQQATSQEGYQCKGGKWSFKQEIVILHLAVSPCRQVLQS